LRKEELQNLARDARLVPESAAIQYRYGLSLYLHGRLEEAEEALAAACRLSPNTPDFLLALALFYQKQERFAEALEYADRLVKLRGGNPAYQQVRAEIEQQARGGR
jgi:tetratricopeptide (TPR) repeat protein